MKNRLRFVTATSLFDGHDVSINIMRRMLQAKGVEVIHLGHSRSALDVVNAALCEDAHAVALSSYQGGHMEYFKYVREILNKAGGQKIKIFGGGGGVITAKEMEELHRSGIDRIYSPQDGMKLGLEGIINDMITKADYSLIEGVNYKAFEGKSALQPYEIAKIITHIEETGEFPVKIRNSKVPVLGITGTGGAGKSSLIDELFIRFHQFFGQKKIALISVDPTRKKTQGALLGDRIRLGAAEYNQFYVRSLATRDSNTELSPQISKVVEFVKSLDFELILVESSGIGQAADAITQVSDQCLYVMTPEYGAATQLEKIEMLEAANFVVLNKFEKPRAEDALRDVRKQYRRNHELFHEPADEQLPVYGTVASRFNDEGVNALFVDIAKSLNFTHDKLSQLKVNKSPSRSSALIAPDRINYLRAISKAVHDYKTKVEDVAKLIEDYDALEKTQKIVPGSQPLLQEALAQKKQSIGPATFNELADFEKLRTEYQSGKYSYKVRDKVVSVDTQYTSLSGSRISKVGVPHYKSIVDTYRYLKLENLPGFFPYTAGVFPFKRKDEDPKRQFAGEGGPLKTNKRFHYLCDDEKAKRLSTAFDSVTLYGEDPDERPDIYGKVGNSGVSIATLQDLQDLYKGFDLCDPTTSVSMTINGPAPIMLAMFMNTAIRSKLSETERKDPAKCLEIMRQVRGTVQADILKEDQAQNTCIFSLEFAMRMMGDVQEYFSKNKIKNYYTVSISGYHIAEAGANPITQLAFTLANGLTFVEYYLSRGMKIDDFSENLSFFFSNGLDPEYTVIGRVARRLWAVTMRERYGANLKSEKFKYHIQTSGRSLHAQEIQFNDIRTTLQALLALSENCNSLHTNAFDEAITTPTEDSVRRAMAIQLIINREFGLTQSDNPLQGSYILEELTDLVEEAVLAEFEKISDKGGVLGAMESTYQRSKIQDESLYYEGKKDSGELPIIGVNTYIAHNVEQQMAQEIDMVRSSDDEKNDQINRLRAFQKAHANECPEALARLKTVILSGQNIFEELLQTVQHCSLGQISATLYEVGGRYRRNM